MSEEPPESAKTFQFGPLTNLSWAILPITASLYLLGYMYLYGYYTGFGVLTSELDLDPRVIIIEGATLAWLPAIAALVIGAVALEKDYLGHFLKRDHRRKWEPRKAFLRVLVLGFSLVFLYGLSAAAEIEVINDAERGKDASASALPAVHIFAKKEWLPSNVVTPESVDAKLTLPL